MSMNTTLFISPHLDDAVFSCAGMMQRAAASGENVVIATVFTEGQGAYHLRRAEDETAVRLLGAHHMHLGQTDAWDRDVAYRSFGEIVFGWQAADEQIMDTTAGLLERLGILLRPQRVFAPLAVGTHVDHRIVHQAAKRAGWPCKVLFYEDRPYAYAHDAVALRLREIGYDGGPVDVAALLGSFRHLPHVKKYLPPGNERRDCEQRLTTPLREGADFRPEAVSSWLCCTPEETRAAHKAATFYKSQITAFCGTRRRLSRMDQNHSLRLGRQAPRTERYWQLPEPTH